jgi:hypothetical protein
MINLGKSLFELAEEQLIKEKIEGIIPCYTMTDIIDYAITIRKYLDEHPNKEIKEILKLSFEEKRRNNRLCRKRYYMRTGK